MVGGSIPPSGTSLTFKRKPDLYPYSGSADAKTGWAALTGFVRFLTQKYLTLIWKLLRSAPHTVLKTVVTRDGKSFDAISFHQICSYSIKALRYIGNVVTPVRYRVGAPVVTINRRVVKMA